MGIKLSEIETGKTIQLLLSSGSNHMEMNAVIMKHIQDNISLIKIYYESDQSLNFENVKTEVEYTTEEGIPYIWRIAKITSFPTGYVLQVVNDGVRHNRRDCFRVGVSTTGKLFMTGRGTKPVMVRDISLTGFSIADRSKDLNFEIGNDANLYFEDLGYVLDLAGTVVRIEERENMLIYGFTIGNLCKDLSLYVNAKQRHNRR